MKFTKLSSHLDLDCFYAQVEHQHLNIPYDRPLAVLQWSNIIAVNYAARAYKIKRGMSASECLKLCPQIVLAKVELIYDGLPSNSNEAATSSNSATINKNTSNAKVSLERYRNASGIIMKTVIDAYYKYCYQPYLTLQNHENECIRNNGDITPCSSTGSGTGTNGLWVKDSAIHKGGIDEIYLDIHVMDSGKLIRCSSYSKNAKEQGKQEEFVVDDYEQYISDLNMLYQYRSMHGNSEEVYQHINVNDSVTNYANQSNEFSIQYTAPDNSNSQSLPSSTGASCPAQDGNPTVYSEISPNDIFVNGQLNLKSDIFGSFDQTILNLADPNDFNLLIAAYKVYRIRREVFQLTGYVVSAGIADNKLIAKQASACRKPNKQTIIPRGAVDCLLKEVRVNDLRGLGGKLGKTVMRICPDATSAYGLQEYSREYLCQHLGHQTGVWLYNACRGIVVEDTSGSSSELQMHNKSLLASKSFSVPLKTKVQLSSWVKLLCSDVHKRIVHEDCENKRRPKSVSISHRGGRPASGSNVNVSLTRTCRLPSLEHRVPSLDELFGSAMKLFETKLPPGALFPCYGLGVAATDMVTLQSSNTGSNILTSLLNAQNSRTDIVSPLSCKMNDITTEPQTVVVPCDPPKSSLNNVSPSSNNYIHSCNVDHKYSSVENSISNPPLIESPPLPVCVTNSNTEALPPLSGVEPVETEVDTDYQIALKYQRMYDNEKIVLDKYFNNTSRSHNKKRCVNPTINSFFTNK